MNAPLLLTPVVLATLRDADAVTPGAASPLNVTFEGELTTTQNAEALAQLAESGMRGPTVTEEGERLWLSLEALAQPEQLIHLRERKAGAVAETICGVKQGIVGALHLTPEGTVVSPAVDCESLFSELSRRWAGATAGRTAIMVPELVLELATQLFAAVGFDVKATVPYELVDPEVREALGRDAVAIEGFLEVGADGVRLSKPLRHPLRSVWSGVRLEIESLDAASFDAPVEERRASLVDVMVVGEAGERYMVTPSTDASLRDCVVLTPFEVEAFREELALLVP